MCVIGEISNLCVNVVNLLLCIKYTNILPIKRLVVDVRRINFLHITVTCTMYIIHFTLLMFKENTINHNVLFFEFYMYVPVVFIVLFRGKITSGSLIYAFR